MRDQIASGGSAPCHLALHPDGTTLFVANYVSGTVAVFPLDAEGRVTGAEPAQVIQHTGSGPRTDRQEGPHAHQTVVSPIGALGAGRGPGHRLGLRVRVRVYPQRSP